MARLAVDAVAAHHRVEVVAAVVGRQRAREPHGAQDRRAEAQPGAAELAAQESVVEAHVVRDEEPPLEARSMASATASKGGASATIASVMPVNCWIAYGMRTPGLTSVEYSSTTPPSSIRTMPTSMTRSRAA